MEQYLLCEHIDDFVIMGKQHNYTGLKWLGEFMKLKKEEDYFFIYIITDNFVSFDICAPTDIRSI